MTWNKSDMIICLSIESYVAYVFLGRSTLDSATLLLVNVPTWQFEVHCDFFRVWTQTWDMCQHVPTRWDVRFFAFPGFKYSFRYRENGGLQLQLIHRNSMSVLVFKTLIFEPFAALILKSSLNLKSCSGTPSKPGCTCCIHIYRCPICRIQTSTRETFVMVLDISRPQWLSDVDRNRFCHSTVSESYTAPDWWSLDFFP